MPQHAIKPAIIGAYSALRGDILKFATNPKRKAQAERFVKSLGELRKWKLVRKKNVASYKLVACKQSEILECGLMALCDIALQPEILAFCAGGGDSSRGVITPKVFALLYAAEPDFTVDVIACIRRKWRPSRTTKATQLFHFISSAENYYIKPPPRLKQRSMGDCVDGEVALAFEKSPDGAVVSIDDVCKARKRVAKLVNSSLKIASRLGLKRNPVQYLFGPKVETF